MSLSKEERDDVKNKMIKPERKMEISPREFIRDDFPLVSSPENRKTPSRERKEKKIQEDFREYYY